MHDSVGLRRSRAVKRSLGPERGAVGKRHIPRRDPPRAWGREVRPLYLMQSVVWASWGAEKSSVSSTVAWWAVAPTNARTCRARLRWRVQVNIAVPQVSAGAGKRGAVPRLKRVTRLDVRWGYLCAACWRRSRRAAVVRQAMVAGDQVARRLPSFSSAPDAQISDPG